jgi:hypothetical protein
MVTHAGVQIRNPLIILSLPRCYSSLACAMLGQHPQLYDLLETQLFEVGIIEEWWKRYGPTHDSDGLIRVVAEILFGYQTVGSVNRARHWLWEHRAWGTSDVAWSLAEQLYPLAFVEKTPVEKSSRQAIRDSLLRRARSFPDAYFLHIVRNPVTYGVSHLEHLGKMARTAHPWRMSERYRMMMDHSTDPPTVDPQVLWLRVNMSINEFLESIPSKRKMRIRGEDLLSDPDGQLREIVQWLGLACDDHAIEEMKHPENSPFARIGPPNAMYGGDPLFFRSPVLRQGGDVLDGLRDSLPWREDGIGLGQAALDLADLFGYPSRGKAPTHRRRKRS